MGGYGTGYPSSTSQPSQLSPFATSQLPGAHSALHLGAASATRAPDIHTGAPTTAGDTPPPGGIRSNPAIGMAGGNTTPSPNALANQSATTPPTSVSGLAPSMHQNTATANSLSFDTTNPYALYSSAYNFSSYPTNVQAKSEPLA